MAEEDITEIKILLQKLTLEIEFGEERLLNKVDSTVFLERTQKIKDEVLEAIRAVDTRVTNLYIKVIGLTSLIAALVTAITKQVL